MVILWGEVKVIELNGIGWHKRGRADTQKARLKNDIRR